MDYTDILYAVEDSTAIITINRPDRYNSFRGRTVEELINALQRAWVDQKVACVILTGAGSKAFCTGGDQKEYVETGGYGTSANGLWEVETLQTTIRDIPKPVIAAVNGFAIGGGHVLHVLCDLTIASDNARFGQAGPRVGSFDAGWGTALLTRIVGEKKAREIWFLCRQYTAEEAKEMGLVNKIVPQAQLMTEAKGWAAEIAALSPTAIKFLKYSFNADSAHAYGTTKMAMAALDGFGHTEEAMEGKRAFVEKRKPDFSPFR
ncbi:1,4-dihydroxy-2-naphthoyl-CoA synthase [Pseudoroseomonas rhizosphaerae]|uniref:1,4-dihydroxy-2-naphthoyl-CoA synthase n=1 Tax=Teichococcus rhizosphaerae TaxID=1335062 RepID=A0A2C6Z771_9PROT|nr:enoyl-CoA hydratase-related protein [Pseudoroseomonas rhizosphaerae]PHK94351.1 1,4-dihydroxy-2-naphthoyl-CoA synthase [Pseudoroseomonas rhizosphaerae]